MPASFKPQAVLILAGMAALLAVFRASTPGQPPGTPRPAETYVEALIGMPRYINPLLASSESDRDLTHLVFSGLTRVDEEGNIAPDLADSWQASPDSRVFTFTIRPDARWHDGQPVTADDVVFTINLIKAPDFPGDPALAMIWHDVNVDAPTHQMVRFTLPTPDAGFIQHTTLGILPRHLWGNLSGSGLLNSELNRSPVGSGAWRLAGGPISAGDSGPGTATESRPTPAPARTPLSSGQLSPEQGVLLEANPDVGAAGPWSQVGRLWFRLYPTFGAALTALRLGEVHGLGHIPTDRLQEVEAVPGVTIHRQALARYTMLLINVRSPLFDRAETRQALEYAIDREALIEQALNGEARPAYSPILPRSWAYDGPATPRKYDPAQARKLLDAAGWVPGPDGVRVRDGVTMTVVLAANSDVPSNVAVAQQVGRYLRDVGIDVRLALVGRDTLLKDYLGPRAFHLVLASWEAQGADPDVYDYWHSSQASVKGGLNFAGWTNPEADRALEAARQTSDRAARARYYAEFQKVFYQDVPAVILYTPLYAYATRLPAEGVTLPSYEMLGPAYRFDTLRNWGLQVGRLP